MTAKFGNQELPAKDVPHKINVRHVTLCRHTAEGFPANP
jgi:hypothetical protein